MSASEAPRAASRQLALQVLYALDLGEGRGATPPSPEEVFDEIAAHFDLQRGAQEYAESLVRGVCESRDSLDEHIRRASRNWRVERMAAVDRNVLRMAAYELTRDEVPASVVIDQAIELARRFGDDPSPAFVNGVLDAVARELGCAVRAGSAS